MYSFFHFVWLAICALLMAAAFVYLRRKRPPLKSVLSLAGAGCVLSEVTKILSVIELVPSADGSAYYPYLELQHLPFHLCSMQILFIFYARFARNGPVKETLLAFMYPSCLIGALLAILIPTTFSGTVDAREAFARPLTYQYFLYHTMLIIFGAYIPMSREIELRHALERGIHDEFPLHRRPAHRLNQAHGALALVRVHRRARRAGLRARRTALYPRVPPRGAEIAPAAGRELSARFARHVLYNCGTAAKSEVRYYGFQR